MEYLFKKVVLVSILVSLGFPVWSFASTQYSDNWEKSVDYTMNGEDKRSFFTQKESKETSNKTESKYRERPEYTQEYFIKFTEPLTKEDMAVFAKQYAVSLKKTFTAINVAFVRIPSESLKKAIQADVRVKYIEQNAISYTQARPEDPRFDEQYYFAEGPAYVGAQEAWEQTTGSEDVIVGVLDTGIAYHHPDLQENMWVSGDCYSSELDGAGEPVRIESGCPHHGWDFVHDDDNPMDILDGHGTHVAGIIGAQGNNNEGGVGMNWDVSLMALRIGRYIHIYNDAVVEAMLFAAHNNVDILNASFGGYHPSNVVLESIEYFSRETGGILVAGSGNDTEDLDESPMYPCAYDHPAVFCVGSINQESNISLFSNYSDNFVDMLAPGTDVFSTVQRLEVDEDPNAPFFEFSFNGEEHPFLTEGWEFGSYRQKAFNAGINVDAWIDPMPVWYDQTLMFDDELFYQAGEEKYIQVPLDFVGDYEGYLLFESEWVCEVDFSAGDTMELYMIYENGERERIHRYRDDDFRASHNLFPVSRSNHWLRPVYLPVNGTEQTLEIYWRAGDNHVSGVDNIGCAFSSMRFDAYQMQYRYETWSGTSMAAPQVTGALALLKSVEPQVPIQRLRQFLVEGARRIAALEEFAVEGRVLDVYASLDALLDNPEVIDICGQTYRREELVQSIFCDQDMEAVDEEGNPLLFWQNESQAQSLLKKNSRVPFAGTYSLSYATLPDIEDSYIRLPRQYVVPDEGYRIRFWYKSNRDLRFHIQGYDDLFQERISDEVSVIYASHQDHGSGSGFYDRSLESAYYENGWVQYERYLSLEEYASGLFDILIAVPEDARVLIDEIQVEPVTLPIRLEQIDMNFDLAGLAHWRVDSGEARQAFEDYAVYKAPNGEGAELKMWVADGEALFVAKAIDWEYAGRQESNLLFSFDARHSGDEMLPLFVQLRNDQGDVLLEQERFVSPGPDLHKIHVSFTPLFDPGDIVEIRIGLKENGALVLDNLILDHVNKETFDAAGFPMIFFHNVLGSRRTRTTLYARTFFDREREGALKQLHIRVSDEEGNLVFGEAHIEAAILGGEDFVVQQQEDGTFLLVLEGEASLRDLSYNIHVRVGEVDAQGIQIDLLEMEGVDHNGNRYIIDPGFFTRTERERNAERIRRPIREFLFQDANYPLRIMNMRFSD